MGALNIVFLLLLGLQANYVYGRTSLAPRDDSFDPFWPHGVFGIKKSTEKITEIPQTTQENHEIEIHSKTISHDKIRDHPSKVFHFNKIVDSLFQNLFHEDESKKKPKLQTIMSLTEIIEPSKHGHMADIPSPFGFKERFFPDPFADISRVLSFMPKLNEVSFSLPSMFERNKRNFCNYEHMFHHYNKPLGSLPSSIHASNSSEILLPVPRHQECNIIPEKFTDSEEQEPLHDETHVKSSCLSNISKSLPYLEGALGGIMIVLLIALLISWRTRRPNNIWANIPFMDKSYTEKV